MKSFRITVRFPQVVYDELAAAAKAKRWSVGQLVRVACEPFSQSLLKGVSDNEPSRKAGRNNPRVRSRAKSKSTGKAVLKNRVRTDGTRGKDSGARKPDTAAKGRKRSVPQRPVLGPGKPTTDNVSNV